tara:strand:+ start:33345 stop:34343 length:999 start_codon:yes stop_codon:yes gene_type:complete
MFFHLLFCIIQITLAFRIKYNKNTPFVAEVHNLDIRKLDMFQEDDLKYLFRSTPVLIFKNQTLTPQEQYKFCSMFDAKHTNKVVHPFRHTEVPDCPQLALRGKGKIQDTFGVKNRHILNAKTFKYNTVWHQDLVGSKDKLPTVVSSMYMLQTPEKGGSTFFASLEKGYENFNNNLKFSKYNHLQCCYSTKKALTAEIDHTGYGRIDNYWTEDLKDLKDLKNIIEDLVIQPLVVYPDDRSMKKTLMITPNKLYNFLGFTPQKSQEIMREILNTCVLVENNICEVVYEENDLVVFNNRKVIHTSSPTEEIEGTRIFSLLFLDTKEKFVSLGFFN